MEPRGSLESCIKIAMPSTWMEAVIGFLSELTYVLETAEGVMMNSE